MNMNKNLLKKILIIIGLALLLYNLSMFSLETSNIFEAFVFMTMETFLEFGEIESLFTIFGTLFLLVGISLKKEESTVPTEINYKRLKIKYNLLKFLGFLPFVAILCIGIFCAFSGFSFFFSTSYGISAFFSSIFLFSLLVWPFYIIGAVLIIKSSQKLKELGKK